MLDACRDFDLARCMLTPTTRRWTSGCIRPHRSGLRGHARRKFIEPAKAGASALAEEAIRRFGRMYEVEGKLGTA